MPRTTIPSGNVSVFPIRLILYRLLVIIENGLILPIIGAFSSIKLFIPGPLRPDKNEKNRVMAIPNAVFVLLSFLLEAPKNTPRATPNKLPIIISIKL